MHYILIAIAFTCYYSMEFTQLQHVAIIITVPSVYCNLIHVFRVEPILSMPAIKFYKLLIPLTRSGIANQLCTHMELRTCIQYATINLCVSTSTSVLGFLKYVYGHCRTTC